MSKIYQDKNVYEAAIERIELIFNDFENICVSFSGGKDSGVVLNLVLDYMRKNSITKKVGVLFIDLEGQYRETIEHIKTTLEENFDLIIPYWVCLPLNLRNAVSVYEPFWCCWEPGLEDKWVRNFPNFPVIKDQDYFSFYRYRMEFEEFVPEFNKWFSGGKKTACLVGIRSDESLNRYRTIVSETKETYHGKGWTTRSTIAPNVYTCFPIYDWRTEDIWAANGKFGWNYNKLYDMFYKAGVGIHEMRICQPFGDDQRIGLDLFRIIEPDTWAKVVNRVSGANFGNIYCGTKVLGYRSVKLPDGHTWKSYTKLLLASLPEETRNNYKEKFIKFMRYWHQKGCPIPEDNYPLLPSEAEILNQKATRGKKDKNIVRYKRIPDCLDTELESHKNAPTWRRMAICILKNDHLCKSLSFTQTKNQVERVKNLIEKYRSL
jgi:predicted phosphoadenosine phosphosulfate sulfurtransferase